MDGRLVQPKLGSRHVKTEISHNNNIWEMLSLEEALSSLQEGVPSFLLVDDLASILHKCRKKKDLPHGLLLHAYMCKSGLDTQTSLGNYLVSMLVEVGSMCYAQQVFDKLMYRNVCLWNSLITGYVKYGESHHAFILYEKMQEDDSLHPNRYTFMALLQACARLEDVERGCKIHAEIERKGFLETDIFVGSSLVDMYVKCGCLVKALEVFDKLPVRNVVSWTALIGGYAEHGHGEEALFYFKHMQYAGISPDDVTFVCSLKACGSIKSTHTGHEIHAEIAKKGMERDHFIGNTLVDMYARCGSLTEAQDVFDKLPVQTVVSWNALIAGYAEYGCGEQALNCFEQMQHEGISPGPVTFLCSLKACSSIGAIDKGGEIHAEIARKGLLERDVFIGSTLVDMYAKCGSLAKAQEVFDKLPVQDVVSWTALISGYVECGHGEEALDCFEQMQHTSVSPGAVTFVCSLKACGTTGATAKGREIHVKIARLGLERELLVGNTLVDMYVKCGLPADAHEVFDKLPVRNIVSWTALIAGYAELGESENVFHVFNNMIGEDIKPDVATFISVLNACSHAGLVDKGQLYFEAMSNEYGYIPTHEHYTCMVDLLGRAGHINKAVAMIKKMPFQPVIVMWHIVLGACRKWGNVEFGRHAFEHAVQLDEKGAAAYVCMSNIYADAAMHEDASKIEAMRVEKQALKKPGHSWWDTFLFG